MNNRLLTLVPFPQPYGETLYAVASFLTKPARPQLGEWRSFDMVAVKHRQTMGLSGTHFTTFWYARRLAAPVSGCFIGYRTVANGWSRRWNDAQPEFSVDSTREVWLFVTDPRKNPVKVFWENVL